MLRTAIASFALLSLSLILWAPDPVTPRPIASPASESPIQYTLLPLPYPYHALEPFINRDIMELHHKKHHQKYITSLNEALKEYAKAIAVNDLAKQIKLQGKLKFNGGGHINHSIFWKNLKPVSSGGGQLQNGALAQAIQYKFGGIEGLKDKMNKAGSALQGSGWVWLAFCLVERDFKVLSTANQDPLGGSLVAIIGIDVWEHAYYLQYLNNKDSYLTQIWNVIDFEEANSRFVAASARVAASV